MNLEDKSIQDINYGIVAVKLVEGQLHVLHFCGFIEEPSLADYDSLRKELEEDAEFGLVGAQFELMPASKQMIEFVKNESNLS